MEEANTQHSGAPRPRSRVLAGLRAKIELSSVSAAAEPRGYYIMRYPVGTGEGHHGEAIACR
jgi:hypothetical protein